MTGWKSGALATVLATATGAGFVTLTAMQGSSRDSRPREKEPLISAVEVFGRGSQIGVSIHDIGEDEAKQPRTGVIVDEVTPDSPAEKAGIKRGDSIVEFDGERVRSVRQFTRLVQETPVGRNVTAVLMRDGQRVSVTVAPERGRGFRFEGDFMDRFNDSFVHPPEPPEPPEAPRPPRPPDVRPMFPEFSFGFRASSGRLGITVEDLSSGLSDYFGVKEGVLVRSVTDGSPAAKAGLKAGDVITAVNGSRVDEPSDVSRAINRIENDAEFTLDIVRDKKPQTLKGKLEPPERSRSRTRTIV